METLSALLALHPADRLAVVGCGGKTTLIETLAKENRTHKVLVLPTTKIRMPKDPQAAVCTSRVACLAHRAAPGVQYMGELCSGTGKLCALPQGDWESLARGYGPVLMEADGSRGLPCKGWGENEPVVPPFATVTLGVLSIGALGQTASDQTVLRLPQFCALTHTCEGQTITPDTLAAMVFAPGGMLKNTAGRRLVFINQADTPALLEQAGALAAHMRAAWPGAAQQIFAGSLVHKTWRAV